MKWLLMVAFVLGAAITWFLTVRRVSRTLPAGEAAETEIVEPEIAPVVSPGGAVAGGVGVAGGADLVAATSAGLIDAAGDTSHVEDPAGDGEDAGDDASGFGGVHTPASESTGAAEGWDRDAEDEDTLLSHAPSGGARASIPPVADATPSGDLAGVGDPAEVAAVDDLEAETEDPEKPDQDS
ncbi:hypothetical protein GCM10009868_12020 [Terrabacter aerolatus]|uniref:Uncharacterized protein n=1 Tax=Terrabacter aerolatus TaxID=422442 RepID=A0A512CXX7_9MICO|nr:hypothetical protein [Terrabacter aerolatus]GEO29058.1 hypothetical protein TAE01_08680 [Terrabacter aerolatus]